jgi:[glutamine synthetase] adenylyltransferase / [glutamine synthetase]-adenylyl-L-tyrosine phosphorylase
VPPPAPDRVAEALSRLSGLPGGEHAVSLALTSADPGMALLNLVGFAHAAGSLPSPLEPAVHLFAGSQSMSVATIRDPALLTAALADPDLPDGRELAGRVTSELRDAANNPERALRRFVRRETLRVLLLDLSGALDLETVAAQISRIADAAVKAALTTALSELTARHGAPRTSAGDPASITVIGLGKLGGGELNYSSDIDVVFLYSEDGETAAPTPEERIENRAFFTRVVERTRHLLADSSGDGHCYRVDLRLRPEGSTGALTRTVASALDYYRRVGRTWERQALIKARVIAGDRKLGREGFLTPITDFVYGKSLSPEEIVSIKKLKLEIERRSGGARQVKAGPGGIRDVEFTVQFLQLLNGNRFPKVRHPGTLPALARLEAAGALTGEECAALRESYIFLRIVEHRLQTLNELATHLLPADAEGLTRLALRMGLSGEGIDPLKEFRRRHATHTGAARTILQRLFHNLFLTTSAEAVLITDFILTPAAERAEVGAWLGNHGFGDPDAALDTLRRLADDGSPRARKFLASLSPRLMLHAAETPDPDRCLRNFERLVRAIGAPATFYQLLGEYEDILSVVTDLAGWSQHLSDLLIRSPAIFDSFADALVVAPGETRLPRDDIPLEEIGQAEASGEMLLDIKDLALLRIGVRDIQGKANTENTAEDLCRLAETILDLALRREQADSRKRHGPLLPGGRERLAVFALGKLGAGEMGYASDLDLLFVGDAAGATAKGTSAGELLTRLAQGLVRRLSKSRPKGRIYDVDARVRPYGKSGPVVTPFESLEPYYRERAQVAELQMLTKARFVCGDEELGRETAEVIESVLYGAPPREGIQEEILNMRRRLEETARGRDVKRGSGGIVDIEFLVEGLKLLHGHRLPSLRSPGTLPALASAAREGLLTQKQYEGLLTSLQFLRSVESRMRIVYDMAQARIPDSEEEQSRLARRLGYEDSEAYPAGAALIEEYGYHTETTRRIFLAVMGAG